MTHLFVPKAVAVGEPRTVLTPDSAKKLIKLGLTVQAESGLGAASDYSDSTYEAVGVRMNGGGLGKADIVFGLEKPDAALLQGMKKEALYMGVLDPYNERPLLHSLASASINSVSMDMIPRSTIAQKMDVLSSQANLAGYQAVIMAADRLNSILPMMMTPAGTLPPARIFIIGVGVAGLQAIATAKRLGARVFAFDTRPVVEEEVKSLGAKFVKIDLGETGQTDQGYAKALTEEQLAKQRAEMTKVCIESDIVITTAKLFGRPAPTLIPAEVVAQMQTGSVIVDLAAETGGNVAGTVLGEEVITENGVRIIGYHKLENFLPAHASRMLAANYANFVEHFWDEESNQLVLDQSDEIIESCLLTHNGAVIHPNFAPTEVATGQRP